MTGFFGSFNARQWMYNRVDEQTNTLSPAFVEGVENFMHFTGNQPMAQSNRGKFYCPCSRCQNNKFLPGSKIWNHILSHGFMPDYYVWYCHGEEINVDLGGSQFTGPTESTMDLPVVNEENCFVSMVNDAFPAHHGDDSYNAVGGSHFHEPPNTETHQFFELLDAANKPLYEGCREGHSQLSLAARFMNNKSDYNMSEKCVDSWAQLFNEYLPAGNQATGSYYATEKVVRNLGLPFHTIDVCPNNCMIYWKEDEKWAECKFCDAPRYKNSSGATKIPFSKMWYLPVADRLKRLYNSHKTASSMTWHADHQSEEGEMCHPSDASEWKRFQSLHPTFCQEPRNVYLGLCTDGFSPFGMTRNHSLWPVILTPYNLPPGMCMQKEYLFLTILNSGPNHPRSSLDVFLRPLIEELKELWVSGVEAYDVSRKDNFNLKAVLLWTISDFPAYGMLSGWTTHGRLSCPICMEDTKAFWLPNGRKPCWFDCHRRHLPGRHTLRKNKRNFLKGKNALKDAPPQVKTGVDIYETVLQINLPRTSDFGGNGHDPKRPGYGVWHNWHKESIFWELPYWKDLNLRHNLDVMHIEKNFFDNILNTVMNVKDRSKDNVKSRLDIAQFCDRPALHLDKSGKAPFPIFRLTNVAKEQLLLCVKHNVRFPDGYAADLAKCADLNGLKFSGMKSHDCHVFMERLFPFIYFELLPRDVHLAISGIGVFFRDLCARSLQLHRVHMLEENIPLILSNLEKIFPPSFFDVMEHLPIHLPKEAELGGPVQYRWMYPFERFFKNLKSKAKNKRYAAASIVHAYINDEISYFTEHYFDASITTKSRSTRFEEPEVPFYPISGLPEIFTQAGRHSGKAKSVWLSEEDHRAAHSYVLRNCDYFHPLESIFEQRIRCAYPHFSDIEVLSKKDTEFPNWIKQYVLSNHLYEDAPFPQWLQEFIGGPINKSTIWSMYFTRGYLFHTRRHGQRRSTCNYGVCVRGQNYSDAADEEDFYGTISDIIELEYPGMINLKITLFKCDWYDPTLGIGTRKINGGLVEILATGKYNKNEPYILASQADQVCYIPYPSIYHQRDEWLHVVKVIPRTNIIGNLKDTGEDLLQHSNDEEVELTEIEDIQVDTLVHGSEGNSYIDMEVGDDEAEDEFQVNRSSSEDEDEING